MGSWPGTDVRETLAVVRDLLADPGDGAEGLPYLPELPDRGPGADLVGRGLGCSVDLPVDLQPSGWRLTDRPGRDQNRTGAFLREDLDELAEAFDGWTGRLKLQVAGPWTLAASTWLPRGERVASDPGATRDLVDSLAEGVRLHLATVQRLVPGAAAGAPGGRAVPPGGGRGPAADGVRLRHGSRRRGCRAVRPWRSFPRGRRPPRATPQAARRRAGGRARSRSRRRPAARRRCADLSRCCPALATSPPAGCRGSTPASGCRPPVRRPPRGPKPQPCPNTRAKMVSTCLVWKARSKFSAIGLAQRRADLGVAPAAWKSAPSSQTFMALRWTMA